MKFTDRLKSAGFWVGLMIFVYAAILFFTAQGYKYTSNYGPGPGFFPMWISSILMILSLAYMITSLVKAAPTMAEVFPKGKELKNILSIISSLVLFIVLAPYFGYIIAGIVMLIPLLIGKFRWYYILLFAAVCTVTIYMVFNMLLQIQLPSGIFGF